MRFSDPVCRLSFERISGIAAPSRTSRTSARFSASVHSFGFGFIASAGGLFRYRILERYTFGIILGKPGVRSTLAGKHLETIGTTDLRPST
jgi:hypothetical protein